jgi:hypothetical protein
MAKVDRAVELEHREASRSHRKEVDPDEVRPDRASRGLGKLDRGRRRAERHAHPSEREVRPPFARRRDPFDRSDGTTG